MRLNQNVIHNLKFRRILNSPNSALIMKFRKKIKKAWEFLLLAHPCSQAFALPQLKDKQRSQPTHSELYIQTLAICKWYSYCRNIIHLRRRSVALFLWADSKFAKFWEHRINVRKRLSEICLNSKISIHRCLDPPCIQSNWLSQKQN